MKRYFIQLAYNGKQYHGWQIQQNAHTVQAEINEKLSAITGEPIYVVGCGRTDTGVHARTFYAHFDILQLPMEEQQLCYQLDGFLPADIAITRIFPAQADWHARFSAQSRTYNYYISRVKDPFLAGFSYHYRGPLRVYAMQQACSYLIKKEDFTSFSKLHTQTSNNICHIREAVWREEGDRLIFTITADRFLRNMVRAIVGTMLEMGRGRLEPGEMERIISSKDRGNAGFSVPAEGLILEKVSYPFL